MTKTKESLWRKMVLPLLTFLFLVPLPSPARADESEFKKIEIEKTTDSSISYWLAYDGCRFFVSKDIWTYDEQLTKSMTLGLATRCSLPLLTQIEVFRHILKNADIQEDGNGVRRVGLPKLGDIEELQRNLMQAAFSSNHWSIAIKSKQSGSSVNMETLSLINETAAYRDFSALLIEFGLYPYSLEIEKAFLARSGDLKLSNLPPDFLVPATAIVSFKVSFRAGMTE